jgi:pimeloyl-ACP methyl ester carboxylesterase
MSAPREDVSFTSGRDRIAAWFYAAEGDGRRPCVVIGHGFAGVKEARLDAFAERFAAAGLSCLVFDYRHFGASGGEPRQLVDIGRQRDDWRAALRYARGRPDVDGDRIALWGTSFGGGLALELASRDPAVAAVVLHLPLVDALATGRHDGIMHTARLAFCGLRDLAGALLRRRPFFIQVVGPPGSLAFMNSEEAAPGYFSIVRNAPAWRNEVAARIVVQMALFRPIGRASHVRCPMFVVVGEQDTITPTPSTLDAARRAPRAEVLSLPCGHFGAYLGDLFERAVEAETAFLVDKLGAQAEVAGGAQRERAAARGT